MPLVKLPNGKIMECTMDHFANVISRQHRGSEIVSENTTPEVVAEAPIIEEEVQTPSLDSMTKDQLEAYAFEKYDVDLDKRKSKANLIKAIEELGG